MSLHRAPLRGTGGGTTGFCVLLVRGWSGGGPVMVRGWSDGKRTSGGAEAEGPRGER